MGASDSYPPLYEPDTYSNASAFLYSRQTGIVDLNTILSQQIPNSGWVLQAAIGINDNDQIIGYGLYNGTPSTFLLSLKPPVTFPVDLASTSLSIDDVLPKSTGPIDIQLDPFVATFTEQATSPLDSGALGTATGNTSVNNGVSTPGRYIRITLPTLAQNLLPSEIIAFTTTQVTVTLFRKAPVSVALGSPPPPDNRLGTLLTGAKNVWLNQHNASDEVLEWYTSGFTTYWENNPLGIGPVKVAGSDTGVLEDWVDISPSQSALPFSTIVQQAEQTIESANSVIVFRRNLFSPLSVGLLILDPGQTSLLMTDPGGNQTGTAADGTIVSHILGSVYFPSILLLYVASPNSGLYQTQVKGIESGNYQLNTGLITNGSLNGMQSFDGSLKRNQSITYFTTVDSNSGSVRTSPNPPTSYASSGLVYNRATQLFGGTITLTNTGPTSLSGTLRIELTGLPSGVSLTNADGIASDGNPYVVLNLNRYSFAGGQSINFTVLISDPTRIAFKYGVIITNEDL